MVQWNQRKQKLYEKGETMNLFDESLQKDEVVNFRKINKVIIQNYRNIPYKEIVLNGANIMLVGNNGVGKTNIIEAIFWALSGVLFNGVALSDCQEIKPYASDKTVVTSVKLEFIHNSFAFERRLEEKWSKDGETKKGTETTLLVNGGASKDQDSAMNALLDYLGISKMQTTFSKNPVLAKTNLFDLLYNAQTLKDIDYKIIKEILKDMFGEADFKAIINDNPTKYLPLVKPLKDHGMDMQALKTDTRAKIFDKNTGYEKQASDLESNVKAFDEQGKKVVDADTLKTAKEQIELIDGDIIFYERQKQTSTADQIRQYDGDIAEKQNAIYKRQNELRTAHEEEIKRIKDTSLETELKSKVESSLSQQKSRMELNEQIGTKERTKSKTQDSVNSKNRELSALQEKLENLRTEWKKLKKPENAKSYTCPKCKSPFIITETVEYQTALKPRLEEIDKNGKETTRLITGLKEGIDTLVIDTAIIDRAILDLQTQRNQLDTNIKTLQDETKALQDKIRQQTATLPVLDLESDSSVLNIRGEIKTIQDKKQTALTDSQKHLETLNSKIAELKLKKQPYTDTLNLESTARSYQTNAELSRKKLAAVNFELQAQKDIETLLKELEKETYTKLDEKVQGVFGSNFQFKLWKLNVSDQTYDARLCEIYVKDIGDRFVNIKNINTGMFPVRAAELIGRIKAHYGIPKSFIFVDELGTLDEKHRETVKTFDEQIFATKVGESSTIKEVLF
jgi:DNA repair exonuclease SbcCD ATPase subunit